jgi:hypothetical protein
VPFLGHLVGGASQVELSFSFFFFLFLATMSQFDWPILKEKKVETMEVPQNRRWNASPFRQPYLGEKGRTLDQKTYGIKARCYWEHPWGTYWELIGNVNGTKEKWKKILSSHPPSPTQNLKEKKSRHFELSACWAFRLATWDFYVPKLFITIFGLG